MTQFLEFFLVPSFNTCTLRYLPPLCAVGAEVRLVKITRVLRVANMDVAWLDFFETRVSHRFFHSLGQKYICCLRKSEAKNILRSETLSHETTGTCRKRTAPLRSSKICCRVLDVNAAVSKHQTSMVHLSVFLV